MNDDDDCGNSEHLNVNNRQHCRLTICIELVERQIVSDDKIQITILILRRGALCSGKAALTSIVIVCLKEEVEERKT